MRAPDFWYPKTRGTPLAALLLAPLGALYAASARLKSRLIKPERISVPVICVGNLTLGGTGKTPVTLEILRRLKSRGLNPFALARGYGGVERGPARVDAERHSAAQVGDEPLLLAARAPTIVSRDRVAGAKLAIAQGADLVVMDDGFQNPSLAKDFSFVVVDGAVLFGNGRVFPAGPLREPVKYGLARADSIILMGGGDLDAQGKPLLRATLAPVPPFAALKNRKLFAFAGIARPEKFFSTLSALELDVVMTRAFPDHYVFSKADIEELKNSAGRLSASPITTEKDFVRLAHDQRLGIAVLPVHADFEDSAALDRLLERALAAHRESART